MGTSGCFIGSEVLVSKGGGGTDSVDSLGMGVGGVSAGRDDSARYVMGGGGGGSAGRDDGARKVIGGGDLVF